MKNLESFGVQELNSKEIKKIDGGLFGLDDVLISVVSYLMWETLTNPKAAGSSFSDGFNSGANAI